MALTNLTPEVWSSILQKYLDKNMVYGSLVNRDYQGEISEDDQAAIVDDVEQLPINGEEETTEEVPDA